MSISMAIVSGFVGSEISAYSPNVCLVADDVCFPTQQQESCIAGVYLSSSYLYWRAAEEGIGNCGLLKTQEINGAVISSLQSKSSDPNFKWSGGYRIAAGYELSKTWDVAAIWTHYHNDRNKHCVQSSHFRWKLDYDTVDLALGYNWSLNSCFVIRPLLGVRLAQIDQKVDLFSVNGNLARFSKTQRHNKQDYKGVGPLLGIKGNWSMACGFSLYASAACSVLYGKYHVRLQNLSQLKNGVALSCAKRHLDGCTAVADLAFGIQYEKSCFDQCRIIFALGVEHHQYFNYNRMGSYGDLCLDGGTFSAGLIF